MKYRKNNESLNKYLAGMIDGDGSIQLIPAKNKYGIKPYLTVTLVQSTVYPKAQETMEHLFDHYGYGNLHYESGDSTLIRWCINGDAALSLLNTIKKHLVVKGQHADRLIEKYLSYKGHGNNINLDDTKTLEELADFVRWSRDNTGPIKPKNYPAKAWLAGYLDSDGSITRYTTTPDIKFNCHKRDKSALELIQKAYGREIKEVKDRPNEISLVYYIGKNKPLAQKLLVPLLKFLRIKKWKAEQALKAVKS